RARLPMTTAGTPLPSQRCFAYHAGLIGRMDRACFTVRSSSGLRGDKGHTPIGGIACSGNGPRHRNTAGRLRGGNTLNTRLFMHAIDVHVLSRGSGYPGTPAWRMVDPTLHFSKRLTGVKDEIVQNDMTERYPPPRRKTHSTGVLSLFTYVEGSGQAECCAGITLNPVHDSYQYDSLLRKSSQNSACSRCHCSCRSCITPPLLHPISVRSNGCRSGSGEPSGSLIPGPTRLFKTSAFLFSRSRWSLSRTLATERFRRAPISS